MSKANGGEIRIALGPEFREDLVSERRDPLAEPQVAWFDYMRLDEVAEGLDEEQRDKLIVALRRVLEWTIAGVKLKPGAEKIIGRKCLSLLWVLNPDNYLQGLSLTKTAALLGVNKVVLSKYTANARRTFGVQNRFQSHATNFNPKPNASG